jgi:glycosyltransferase involved in cell wall biosynthesis
MKIAIITSGFLPVVDGVTITVFQRIQKLSQLGHQVLLFCPDYSALPTIYPHWKDYTGDILPGVRVINLDSTAFTGVDFERNVSQKSYQIVLEELEQFQPDIILVVVPERLWLGFLKRPGIDFSKQYNIPCVSFFHSNLMEYLEDYLPLPYVIIAGIQFLLKFHFRWTYNGYNATLTASSSSAKKLVKVGLCNVIFDQLLGVDLEQFNPYKREENFFAKHYHLSNVDDKVKLIFLGRLTPDKGWKFTLKSLPKIQELIDLDQVSFIIAGDGELKDEIAQNFKSFTSNIHFLGRVEPSQVAGLLANSDIHITTSEKETRGLTILEAFASGIPVLAPAAGGVIDSIESGKNGLLFTPKNADDFAKKLKVLVENSGLREQMGQQGRETVKDFSWDEAVQNLLEIWKQQIEQK